MPSQGLGSKLELTPEDKPWFFQWEIRQLGCTLRRAWSPGQLETWLAARRQMGPAVVAVAALLRLRKTPSSGNCGIFATAHQVSRYGVACLVRGEESYRIPALPNPAPISQGHPRLLTSHPSHHAQRDPEPLNRLLLPILAPEPDPQLPHPALDGPHMPALAAALSYYPCHERPPNSCSAWVLPYLVPSHWWWCV